MGKRDKDFAGGGVGNERLAHRGDKGWENPRDAGRNDADVPEQRSLPVKLNRYGIGSNDPDFRR